MARKKRQLKLKLHEGKSAAVVARNLQMNAPRVTRIGWRYVEEGLEGTLYERQRRGRERVLSDREANQIIAMVCSGTPI